MPASKFFSINIIKRAFTNQDHDKVKMKINMKLVFLKLRQVQSGTYFSEIKTFNISHYVKLSFKKRLSTEGTRENMIITRSSPLIINFGQTSEKQNHFSDFVVSQCSTITNNWAFTGPNILCNKFQMSGYQPLTLKIMKYLK